MFPTPFESSNPDPSQIDEAKHTTCLNRSKIGSKWSTLSFWSMATLPIYRGEVRPQGLEAFCVAVMILLHIFSFKDRPYFMCQTLSSPRKFFGIAIWRSHDTISGRRHHFHAQGLALGGEEPSPNSSEIKKKSTDDPKEPWWKWEQACLLSPFQSAWDQSYGTTTALTEWIATLWEWNMACWKLQRISRNV